MKALEEKILAEGKVYPGHILKVGSFLNQQLDCSFLMEMGKEIARLYKDEKVTKIINLKEISKHRSRKLLILWTKQDYG